MRVWLLGLLLLTSGLAHAEETRLGGKTLFEQRCAICHQLPEPEMLNHRQWAKVIKTMQTRMQQADITPLNEDEIAAIMKYLELQADD